MSAYKNYLDESLSANPIAKVIGGQLAEFADRLGEIAEVVNKGTDPNAPKKPTVGEIMKEAKGSEDTETAALLDEVVSAREAAKAAYRVLLVHLHPEFEGTEDDDQDDDERSAMVAEAKDVFGRIKAGLAFLATQPGIPEDFTNTFLGMIPVVEGARQRTSVTEGGTIRPRFETVLISGPNEFSATATSFTDTVKALKNKLEVSTSDLADAWVAAVLRSSSRLMSTPSLPLRSSNK
jgi:hypothetical protein